MTFTCPCLPYPDRGPFYPNLVLIEVCQCVKRTEGAKQWLQWELWHSYHACFFSAHILGSKLQAKAISIPWTQLPAKTYLYSLAVSNIMAIFILFDIISKISFSKVQSRNFLMETENSTESFKKSNDYGNVILGGLGPRPIGPVHTVFSGGGKIFWKPYPSPPC